MNAAEIVPQIHLSADVRIMLHVMFRSQSFLWIKYFRISTFKNNRNCSLKIYLEICVKEKIVCQQDSLYSPPLHITISLWRHQMETFAALLATCAGNSPAPGEFPAQRPVTRGFDVFFDLRLNKRLSKQSWGWWFETLSCPLWRHRNDAFPSDLSMIAGTDNIMPQSGAANLLCRTFNLAKCITQLLCKYYLVR